MKVLADDHKEDHLAAAAQFLALYNAEGEDLFHRIVTGDKKSVHHSSPPHESGFQAVGR